ncbi:MAG: class I SAM-dependent methyltransferase [Methylomonas sp.]
MELSNKYDQFYASDLSKEPLKPVVIAQWPKNRLEAIVAMGGHGDRILDIGCGNGNLIYQFKEAYSELIGLEYSFHRLEQARINLDGLNFLGIQGSAENMHEIESDSIDRIISADTIEHIPDVYAACAEMFRVLKPGGFLVINTPNIAFVKKRVLLLLGRFPSTSQPNEGIGSDILFDGGHLHYFTFRSLRIVLEKANFKMVKKVGYGSFGKIHDTYPELLSGGVQWVAQKPE